MRAILCAWCRLGEIRKTQPQRARLVACKRKRPRRSSAARAHADRAREPRGLSPALSDLSAEAIMQPYARYMQIAESFLDLKDPQHGTALRQSLTRKAPYMESLMRLAYPGQECWPGGAACWQVNRPRISGYWRMVRRSSARPVRAAHMDGHRLAAAARLAAHDSTDPLTAHDLEPPTDKTRAAQNVGNHSTYRATGQARILRE